MCSAMKSPRRRGQAVNESASGGLTAKLNPVKARKDTLEELAEVLQSIPHAYQQQDFSAVAQVIRMIEAGDLEGSMNDLERHCGEMDACMKKVAAVYESGFSSSLSSYGIIFDHVPPAIEGVASMGQKLEAAAGSIRPQTTELQGLQSSLETTECVIDMLRKIEDLAQAPDAVAQLVEHKQWQLAAKRVLHGVAQLLGDDLLGIKALEMLRKRMLDLKNLLPEMLLSELKSYVYLYTVNVSKEDLARRVAALRDGSLKQAHEIALAEGGSATSPPVVSESGGSPNSTTTDDESSPGTSHKHAIGSPKKRTVQTHRRGKSISGAPPTAADSRRPRSGSFEKGVPPVLPAAVSAAVAGSASAAGTVAAVAAREDMMGPIDPRHDVARYMASLIGALHVMDKAASSLNELAGGSDAAHKRLLDAEFNRQLEEDGKHHVTHVMTRHLELLERREWAEHTAAMLRSVVDNACDRLALVMHHHLIVAAAGRALAKEKPAQASSKYSPERQWRSIQQALIDLLEHFLFDVKSSHIVEEKTVAAMPQSATDNAAPLFRFSASSAAYRGSSSAGSSTGSTPTPSSEHKKGSGRHLARNISLTDLSYVVSPGQQVSSTARNSSLHPSPFCFSAVLPTLRHFDSRVRSLSAMLSSRDDELQQSERVHVLDVWLDNFVASVYVPRIRMESLRVLHRSMAGPLVAGSVGLSGVLSSATLLMRILGDLAADARDSPQQLSAFVGLARELVSVFVKNVEQRLLQIMLHTETFRRIKGTPVLELLEKDDHSFSRDFRSIERRYLEGEKMVEADDLVREASELAGVSLLASSLAWLRVQVGKTTLLKGDEAVDLQCGAMHLTCLASMKLELRHHCYHHLWQLNVMAYHGVPLSSDPDPSVRNLSSSLSHFQEVLAVDAMGFVVEGLSALIGEMLMSAVRRLERIDSAGRHKMQLNVFTLQQRLSGTLFKSEEDEKQLDKVALYYGLVDLPFPRIVRSIVDGSGPTLFALEQYEVLLAKRDDAPLTAEARDALERALQTRKNEAT